MAEDQCMEFTKYYDLKKVIMGAIYIYSADPFFRPPLEDLQKTVRSMELMVKDMEVSERESPRHKFMTDKLLPLLEQVKILVDSLLETELPVASSRVGVLKGGICRALGIEVPSLTLRAISYKNNLEIIRESLKNLFRDYVQEELEMLADLSDDQEVVDERELAKLLNNLLFKIKDEASKPSSKPVFTKIKVTLDFLGAEITSPTRNNPPQLLHLLKEIKLLYRFLNGDHGLSIPDLLLERELALRKFVTDNMVVSHLTQLDRLYEKQEREKEIRITCLSLLFSVAGLACVLSMSEEHPVRDSGAFMVAMCIFLFACLLVIEVFTHIRLGVSGAQGQRLNSDNSSCGDFCLLGFVAVFGLLVAIVAMAVTDEPKKYDIFLNFRGSKEIRYTVAGVFHRSLENANISTFFDERSSRKAKRYPNEIENAISTSVGAITIFSESYGESDDCLDELVLVLEREKTSKGYIIRPIFYDVEPDDLTDPESKFGQGFQKHYKTQPNEKVEEWKEALQTVTLIGGDVHKSSHQHLDELVHRVVEDFKNQLGNRSVTKDNTILRWRGLIMKVTQPFTLQIWHVKLEVDLKNRNWHVTAAG